MAGSYDYRLVAFSVAIAMVAAYAALDLGGRVTASRGGLRFLWLAGGSIVMGTGIWSMHYIGMLAYSLPVNPSCMTGPRFCCLCWRRWVRRRLL